MRLRKQEIRREGGCESLLNFSAVALIRKLQCLRLQIKNFTFSCRIDFKMCLVDGERAKEIP